MHIDLTYPPLLQPETLSAGIDRVNECSGGGQAMTAAFERC